MVNSVLQWGLWLLILLLLGYSEACCYASTRTSLEIHVFDVGQADSQLIVFPSGFSMLIDVGEPLPSSSPTYATYVAGQLDSILGTRHLDVIMASHIHSDHIGLVSYSGLWYLLANENVTCDLLVDRNLGIWNDADSNGKCKKAEVIFEVAGETSANYQNWVCYVANTAWLSAVRTTADDHMCSSTLINPPDSNAKITIVAADAYGATSSSGVNLHANLTYLAIPPSEDDYCLGILLQLGNFAYATAGDLIGIDETESYYTYDKQTVSPRIGNVDVYRVNHHGSSSSSTASWLSILDPTVSVISVGADNTYGHPNREVLNRLKATSSVFLTEQGSTSYSQNYTDTHISSGGNGSSGFCLTTTDVIITYTPGGTTYKVKIADGSSFTYPLTTKSVTSSCSTGTASSEGATSSTHVSSTDASSAQTTESSHGQTTTSSNPQSVSNPNSISSYNSENTVLVTYYWTDDECTGDIYMVYGEDYGLDCSTFGSDTSCSYHQTFGCASSTDDIDWYNIFPDGYVADFHFSTEDCEDSYFVDFYAITTDCVYSAYFDEYVTGVCAQAASITDMELNSCSDQYCSSCSSTVYGTTDGSTCYNYDLESDYVICDSGESNTDSINGGHTLATSVGLLIISIVTSFNIY